MSSSISSTCAVVVTCCHVMDDENLFTRLVSAEGAIRRSRGWKGACQCGSLHFLFFATRLVVRRCTNLHLLLSRLSRTHVDLCLYLLLLCVLRPPPTRAPRAVGRTRILGGTPDRDSRHSVFPAVMAEIGVDAP
ncbi:hypothetical protein BDZ89DRAFT_687063 [Hymenopellis radicata]|nr:hypothetical protein BDZ89DRAFT_687063 [Hymenopellis radicata]